MRKSDSTLPSRSRQVPGFRKQISAAAGHPSPWRQPTDSKRKNVSRYTASEGRDFCATQGRLLSLTPPSAIREVGSARVSQYAIGIVCQSASGHPLGATFPSIFHQLSQTRVHSPAPISPASQKPNAGDPKPTPAIESLGSRIKLKKH